MERNDVIVHSQLSDGGAHRLGPFGGKLIVVRCCGNGLVIKHGVERDIFSKIGHEPAGRGAIDHVLLNQRFDPLHRPGVGQVDGGKLDRERVDEIRPLLPVPDKVPVLDAVGKIIVLEAARSVADVGKIGIDIRHRAEGRALFHRQCLEQPLPIGVLLDVELPIPKQPRSVLVEGGRSDPVLDPEADQRRALWVSRRSSALQHRRHELMHSVLSNDAMVRWSAVSHSLTQ